MFFPLSVEGEIGAENEYRFKYVPINLPVLKGRQGREAVTSYEVVRDPVVRVDALNAVHWRCRNVRQK